MVNADAMRTCLIRKNVSQLWIETIVTCATSSPTVTIFVSCLKLRGVPIYYHDEAVDCYYANNK